MDVQGVVGDLKPRFKRQELRIDLVWDDPIFTLPLIFFLRLCQSD